MKTAAFILIAIALWCTLNTRRIGPHTWQFYAIGALVALAGVVGRFA